MDKEKHSPTRRAVIGHVALGLAAGAALDGMSPALAQTDRKTFVLVHGSSAGGWCYRRVADILEKQGHKVFAPTLTGLGERSHLMSGMITLDGTVFRIGVYHPGVAPRNHRTESIDYAIVLSGEIDMEIDGAIVHLRAGDVLVQRGTIHNWTNPGTEPCVVAFVLVAAKPVERAGKLLGAIG